ncbi:hypothetical protein DFH11DRAFT_1623600 [Phellopilus nigrolimitatus]|nr:hypothetical protein DFH11DRAFT_1623600 [Phellopilus nigrolimitatus]
MGFGGMGFGGEGSGSGSASPAHSVASAFASGPRSKYQRPDDWRPEFSMPKRGALTRLLSFGKSSPKLREGTMSKPALHWTLDAKAASCSWDVRRPPETYIVLPDQRHLTYLELQEGALNPPPLRLRLTHPLLPWTVHVAAGPGEVITIAHLLWSLHAALDRPVRQGDFWNPDISEDDRKVIHGAWMARCGGDQAVAAQGVKRVDYLGDRYVFEGLKRTAESWEMKMKPGRI